MDTLAVLRSLSLFVVAGVCEIGGGWLMWKWLREDKPGWWGLAGPGDLRCVRTSRTRISPSRRPAGADERPAARARRPRMS